MKLLPHKRPTGANGYESKSCCQKDSQDFPGYLMIGVKDERVQLWRTALFRNHVSWPYLSANGCDGSVITSYKDLLTCSKGVM